MVSSRGAALLQAWARRTRARATRDPRTAGQVGGTTAAAGGHTAPALGTRLMGAAVPLVRLMAVAPGTVALLYAADGSTVVHRPGDLLLPRLLDRAASRTLVRPVTTSPVHLELTVEDLVALDGYPVEAVTIRLELQLDDTDGHAGLADLVAEHGDGSERVLLDRVQRDATAAVRGAVRMNRRDDLQRLGLAQVLAERWLPSVVAGGLLHRRGHTVLDHPGLSRAEEPGVVPGLAPSGAAASPATAEAAPLGGA